MAEGFDSVVLVVGFAQMFEAWHEPRQLAGWLAASPLALPRSLAVGADDLRAARRAGGAFRALLRAAAQGHPAPRADVTAVNRLAARPPLAPRLTGTGRTRAGATGGPSRRWVAPVTVDQVLSTLARELIDLLAGEPGRIRECAADDCEAVFVDTSRSGARRWCSMARCGNRRKVRAFRERALS
jgi:predicted RNA-binding Zn ribbon-like protein